MIDTDPNPLTPAQRARLRAPLIGRMVSPGFYRCFCHNCGMPLVHPNPHKARNEQHECDECMMEATTKVRERLGIAR